jgi:hypothetical protein
MALDGESDGLIGTVKSFKLWLGLCNSLFAVYNRSGISLDWGVFLYVRGRFSTWVLLLCWAYVSFI